jgi:hypothetical protein
MVNNDRGIPVDIFVRHFLIWILITYNVAIRDGVAPNPTYKSWALISGPLHNYNNFRNI